VFFDQTGDHTARLLLLDEGGKKGGGGGIPFHCPHCLLNGGETPFENARTGYFADVVVQRRPQPGEGIEFFGDEQLERPRQPLGTDKLSMFEAAGQIQIVRTAPGHGDTHAFPVDIDDRLKRRPFGNEIGRLNFHIGGGEIHHLGALRLGPNIADVPRPGPRGGGDIAEFLAAVERNPDDHQARFDLALALFAGGEKEEAMDALIEIIRRDRSWKDGEARTQLLQMFEALGPADPMTVAGRRRLSSVLFS